MKKLLKYSAISLLVIFVLLLIAPFIFKKQLIQAAKNFVNEQLVADVNFNEDETSVSFLRSFPNVSFSLAELSIVGRDSFAGDTIAYIPKLRSTLDIQSLWRDKTQIEKLKFINPILNIEVLRSGKPNWEIWRTDTAAIPDTAETKFGVALQQIAIENGTIDYKDYSLGFFTNIKGLNHTATGDFTQDKFDLQNELMATEVTMEYGGVPWLYKAAVAGSVKLGMDIPKFKIDWNSDDVKINDLKLHSDGWVQLNDDDIDMDFKFNALENTFKSFLSMVPGMYQNNFKDLKAGGTMNLKGSMIGKMTDDLMPKTVMDLVINNGSFAYPGLPREVKAVNMVANYSNPNGLPDNSVINISKLEANVGGDPLQAKLLLKTPESNPYLDAMLKGKVDLANLASLIPLEKGTVLKGLINADIMAKGYIKSAANNYATLDAKGFFKCKDIIYKTAADPNGTELKTIDVEISPKYATISQANGHLGRNDFAVNGKVENYLAYVFSDETLTGTLDLKSNYLNANDFMSETTEPEPKPTDSNNISIVALPTNLDWNMTADIKKLIYDNFILDNVSGDFHLANAAIEFSNVQAELAGGSVSLDGVYDSKNIKNPFTQLKTQLGHFDIGKSFQYFTVLNKFTNLAKYINGVFDAKIDMNSILDENMQPNYNSMNVNAVLTLSNTFIKNFDVLGKVGEMLKLNWLKDLKLNDKTLKFNISNGVLTMLDSVNLDMGKGAYMKLSGSSKLNQTIAYGGRMVIPRELFGKANEALNKWKALAANKNWNLDVAKDIPIDITIGGTFMKPNVKLGLQSMKNSLIDPLKNQVINKAKDEGNKKLQEYLAKAQIQADRIKAEAKRRADQIRAAGQKSGDSIRNETARRADKLRDEAKVRAYNLKQEGETQKQSVITKANEEVDALVAQAQPQGPIAVLAAKKTGEKIKAEALIKANRVQADYDAKINTANKTANDNIDKVQGEGNLRAKQVEDQANEKASRIELEANTKADDIMREAREKGQL